MAGVLDRPRFGLAERAYAELAARVGAVWHAGAEVRWTRPYEALVGANVEGTLHVLRFACAGNVKRLHHLSTVGVFASATRLDARIGEDELLPAGSELHTGYAQSKWVAERLVRQAMDRGLPADVFRINTAGDATTGIMNPRDYLTLLVRGCLQLGSAPLDLELGLQGAPIDFASRAMVHVSQHEAPGQTYHVVNQQVLPFRTLLDSLKAFAPRLRFVGYHEWRAQVEARTRADRSFALAGMSPVFDQTLGDRAPLPTLDRANLNRALQGSGIECPALGAGLVEKYLLRLGDADTRSTLG